MEGRVIQLSPLLKRGNELPFTDPTVQDFKDKFVRDFKYCASSNCVTDPDIQRGLDDAGCFINADLHSNQEKYNNGYLLLAAHCMVMNLRASSQGTNGKYDWMNSSKTVGQVSETFNIPDRILENPEFAMLSGTNYGAKYLFMILPQISGQIFTVQGRTQP